MSEGEPEWLEEDTNAVLAFIEYEDMTCGGCGLSFNETLKPENDRKYSSEPVVCHACAARNMASEAFREAASDYDKAGALFPVKFND